MKNGAVLAKLAQDKRVKNLSLTSDNAQVSIVLADGYYVPKAPRDFVNTFCTARAAHQFIKSALKIPTPRDGYKIVANMMTGQLVEEAIDTPYACSVASKSYWCS